MHTWVITINQRYLSKTIYFGVVILSKTNKYIVEKKIVKFFQVVYHLSSPFVSFAQTSTTFIVFILTNADFILQLYNIEY